MPQFDVSKARQAGYSDDEIIQHLSQTRKFNVEGARKSGYSNQEIIDYLSGQPQGKQTATSPAATPPARPGFVERAYDASLGGMIDLGKSIWQKGAPRVVDEMGTAMAKRFEENPRGFKHLLDRAADVVVGPTLDLVAEDVRQGNYAGAAGTVAGNVAMFGVPAMLRAPGTKQAVAASRAKVAEGLQESARAQYGRVLNPTRQGTKYLSQTQVAPGLVERGVVAGTMKGLQGKAQARVAALGEAIGDYWATMPDDALAPVNDIIRRVRDEAIETNTVTSASGKRVAKSDIAQRAIDQAESLAKTLETVAEIDANGIQQIPVKKLRELRQHFDDVAARAKRYQGADLADASRGEIFGKVADAIREEFAKADPNLAALNKEYSFWRNTQEVIDQTVMRREGQARPLGRKIAEAAGTAVGAQSGPVGALLGKYGFGMLEKLTSSPAWNTLSAVGKDRLAKAIAGGQKGKAIIELEKLRMEAIKGGGQSAQTGPRVE